MNLQDDVQLIKQRQFNYLIAVISFLLTVVLAITGWWVTKIWDTLDNQQQLIANVQIELAKNYVPRIELQAQLDRINTKLDEIQRDLRNGAR